MFPAVVWGCRSLDLGPTLLGRLGPRPLPPPPVDALNSYTPVSNEPRSDSTTSSHGGADLPWDR